MKPTAEPSTNNDDFEANLWARAYELILSWSETPNALDQAADEALELAFSARQAAESGDIERAGKLRAEHDSLWDEIEGALDGTKH